jgi:hypothetical protein
MRITLQVVGFMGIAVCPDPPGRTFPDGVKDARTGATFLVDGGDAAPNHCMHPSNEFGFNGREVRDFQGDSFQLSRTRFDLSLRIGMRMGMKGTGVKDTLVIYRVDIRTSSDDMGILRSLPAGNPWAAHQQYVANVGRTHAQGNLRLVVERPGHESPCCLNRRGVWGFQHHFSG